jgi:hypothetical protein
MRRAEEESLDRNAKIVFLLFPTVLSRDIR